MLPVWIFASVVVCFLAVALVFSFLPLRVWPAGAALLAISWLLAGVVPQAKAGALGCDTASQCDQGQAYATCMSSPPNMPAPNANRLLVCEPGTSSGHPAYYSYYRLNGTGGGLSFPPYSGSPYLYGAAKTCASRPNQFGWLPQPNGNGVCFNGCAYVWTIDGGAGTNYYSPNGSICKASTETPEPKLDTDGDGVPDDEDAFPNDPNEWADSDGDGIGDNADVAPDDATNGDDSGEGDEKDNSAQGGGDCKAPPSCSGDGIQCNQLYQQWSMRCKGATVTGDSTNCTGSYTCSGDSAQCALVALARKNACRDLTGGGSGGGGSGDANGNGVADVLEGTQSGGGLDGGGDDTVTRWGIGVSTNLLDQENIFGAASCPQLPTITIWGKTINTQDFPYWCTLIAIMRACILILGAYSALRILLGGIG